MQRLLCVLLTVALLCGSIVSVSAAEDTSEWVQSARAIYLRNAQREDKLLGFEIVMDRTVLSATENLQAVWASDAQPIPSEQIGVQANKGDNLLITVAQSDKFAACTFLPGSFLLSDGSVNETPIEFSRKNVGYAGYIKLGPRRLEECRILPKSIKNDPRPTVIAGETVAFDCNGGLVGRLQVRYGDTVSARGEPQWTAVGEGEQSCAILLNGVCMEENYPFCVVSEAAADKIFRTDRFLRSVGVTVLYPAFPLYIFGYSTVFGVASWIWAMQWLTVFGIVFAPIIIPTATVAGVGVAFTQWQETVRDLKTPYSWKN